MDITDIRTLITVISFTVFVAIVLWALSGRRQASFAAAASQPVEDDDSVPSDRNVHQARVES